MNPSAVILEYADDVTQRKFDAEVLDIPAFHGGIPDSDTRIRSDRAAYMLSDLVPLDSKSREQRPLRVRHGQVVRLPTDLPAGLGSFDGLLDMFQPDAGRPGLERLAIVLAESASGSRWEPFNTYQVHRGIASARCLFTCDLRVAVRDPADGSYTLYRYLGDEHALAWLGALQHGKELFGGAAVAFAITGDIARCIDPYGDFAPNLIGPEAGMLAAQLEYVCKAVGWQTRCPILADPLAAAQAWMLENVTELALATVLVDTADLSDFSPQLEPVSYTEPAWPHQLLNEYPRLEAILAPLRDGTGFAQARTAIDLRLANASRPDHARARHQSELDDVLDVARRRNSGSYLIGFVPRAESFDQADLSRLIDDWIRLVRLQDNNDFLGIDVHATVSVLRLASGKPARHRIDFRSCTSWIIDMNDLTLAHSTASTMPMANFREMNMVITFSCDFAKVAEELGPRGFLLAHQVTGWLAHHFGLAAARQNLFSRPVRMYDDNVLADLIPIDGQPTIQLLCGHNRGPRFTFAIG